MRHENTTGRGDAIFRVVEEYGDYSRTPFGPQSQKQFVIAEPIEDLPV